MTVSVAMSGVKKEPPPAELSITAVACEPTGMAAFTNGAPMVGDAQ